MNGETGKTKNAAYTCNEYRLEMMLLSLECRLKRQDLTEAERKSIESEIDALMEKMDMH